MKVYVCVCVCGVIKYYVFPRLRVVLLLICNVYIEHMLLYSVLHFESRDMSDGISRPCALRCTFPVL